MEEFLESRPGQKGLAAAGTAAESHQPAAQPGEEAAPAAFEWQAVLLRYLPDPRGPQHAVKRFGLR